MPPHHGWIPSRKKQAGSMSSSFWSRSARSRWARPAASLASSWSAPRPSLSFWSRPPGPGSHHSWSSGLASSQRRHALVRKAEAFERAFATPLLEDTHELDRAPAKGSVARRALVRFSLVVVVARRALLEEFLPRHRGGDYGLD